MLRKITTRLTKAYSRLALLSLELIVVLVAFVASFILVVLTVRRIFWQQKEDLDHRVFDSLQGIVGDSTTTFMQFITFFGSHEFLIPAYLLLIAYFLFIRKEKWYSIKIPAVAISSLVLMFGLKRIFNRPRPLVPLLEQVAGLSFPSGHAFMAFSFFGLLIFIVHKHLENKSLKRVLIVFLVLFILLIGFSRIYLRVHYASDVIAGFSLGLMWLVISMWILRRMEKFSQKKIQPAKETVHDDGTVNK